MLEPKPGMWGALHPEPTKAPEYWEFTLSWNAPGGVVFHVTLRVRAGLVNWLANVKHTARKRLSAIIDSLLGGE